LACPKKSRTKSEGMNNVNLFKLEIVGRLKFFVKKQIISGRQKDRENILTANRQKEGNNERKIVK
jgi:hypothetical protein